MALARLPPSQRFKNVRTYRVKDAGSMLGTRNEISRKEIRNSSLYLLLSAMRSLYLEQLVKQEFC